MLPTIATAPGQALASNASLPLARGGGTMRGIGMTPEAIETNSITYVVFKVYISVSAFRLRLTDSSPHQLRLMHHHQVCVLCFAGSASSAD
jgi:hypothetical protein